MKNVNFISTSSDGFRSAADVVHKAILKMAFWTKCLHEFSIVVLVLFVIFGLIVCDDEFYSTLGVSRTANSDEIRKAYRRLAREW